MTKSPAIENATKPEFPSERGNHHSSMVGYSIEAMFDSDSPQMIAGRLYDNRWRTVHFDKSPEGFGVPAGDRFNSEVTKHGLFGYEAAQALRWWLHAIARNEGHEYCLKTRLIAHKVVSETTITAEKAIDETQYQRGMPSSTQP